MERYQLPVVRVGDAVQREAVATVSIEFDPSRESYLGYPIAPGDLRFAEPFQLVFPLHQLIDRDGLRLVFETYEPQLPLPTPGESFTFCSWFLPAALNALRDRSVHWDLRDYPDNGDHDHCLLTSATLAAYADYQKRGYHSSYGWVTVAAYQEYIERDVLRVRRAWRSIESPA
jgi:hypothetical protein